MFVIMKLAAFSHVRYFIYQVGILYFQLSSYITAPLTESLYIVSAIKDITSWLFVKKLDKNGVAGQGKRDCRQMYDKEIKILNDFL